MKTLEWVKTHELPTGGIEAWDGLGRPYPECTGYLIPTLLNYGETELANRLGDWLESIQNGNGSFNGIDGIPRAFDTGACYEGLAALGRTESAEKAKAWLNTQVLDNKAFRTSPDVKATEFYNYRVNGLLQSGVEEEPTAPASIRTHYLAYGLEGFYNLRHNIQPALREFSERKSLLPMFANGTGSDTCATAQIAVLCLKNNIPCDGLIEAVRAQVDTDGGVFHDSGDRRKCSWTAKYYLDMEYLCTHKPSKKSTRTSRKT